MLDFLVQLMTNPAIMLGIVAFIGLLIQKNSAEDVIKGSFKTILGMLILTAGSGLIAQYITPFSEMFTRTFNLTGVVPFDEAVIGGLSENIAEIARNTSLILAIGFVVNLVIARLSPFKYIFLTGHMMWVMAGAIAWAFYDLNYSTTETLIWGSLIQGISLVLLPAIAQPIMRKLTGSNDIAYGHLTTTGVVASAYIGKLFGNRKHNAEDMKMPKGLGIFKDTAISMSLVMLIIYLITSLFAGAEIVGELSGDQNWIVFSIIQAFGFTAGVLILLQGVRMFLGEIIPAFRGVAIKLVPGAKPGLDVPVIFNFGPISLMIGFITAVAGTLVGLLIAKAFGTIIPLPAIIGAFFTGGVSGIFGNALGGRRGAAIAGFIYGIILTVPVALFYPMFGLAEYGVTGLAFLVSDGLIVLSLIKLFTNLNVLPYVVVGVIALLIGSSFFVKKQSESISETDTVA